MSTVIDHLQVTPSTQRLLGRGLQVVAVLGGVIALVGGVVGWRVVGAIDDLAVESTEVTADAMATVGDTLELAAELIESVDATLVALEDGLATTSTSVADGAEALDSVSRLAEDAAPALDSATRTLRSLEGVGGSIDGVLRGLSALPLAPDYDPERGFGATVGDLADDLEPLSDSFATTADDLDDVAASSGRLEQDLEELTAAVSTATEQLAASEQLIDDYRDTAERASDVSAAGTEGIGGDLTLLRILLLLGGLVFAAGQVVPWLLGRALLAGAVVGSGQ